ATCSRTVCVFSCGSVTAWTCWGRFGRRAASIRWTVTTAPVLTDSCCAPITAARPPAVGAPGPAGRHAALPVGGAKEPNTGLWSLRVKEWIASLRKSITNHVTQDPAHLSVSMTTRSSMWETHGCRESVSNACAHQRETTAKTLTAKWMVVGLRGRFGLTAL
ncbi:hypothetical protein LDENG_00266040, partial [Lucifuga dentata]